MKFQGGDGATLTPDGRSIALGYLDDGGARAVVYDQPPMTFLSSAYEIVSPEQ